MRVLLDVVGTWVGGERPGSECLAEAVACRLRCHQHVDGCAFVSDIEPVAVDLDVHNPAKVVLGVGLQPADDQRCGRMLCHPVAMAREPCEVESRRLGTGIGEHPQRTERAAGASSASPFHRGSRDRRSRDRRSRDRRSRDRPYVVGGVLDQRCHGFAVGIGTVVGECNAERCELRVHLGLLPGGCSRLGRENLEGDRDLVGSELSIERPFAVEAERVEGEAELVGAVGPRALVTQVTTAARCEQPGDALACEDHCDGGPFRGGLAVRLCHHRVSHLLR